MGDIVITGTRFKNDDGSWGVRFRQETGVPGVRFYTPNEVSPDGSAAEPELQVSIKLVCNTPENCAKVQEAAQKLAAAVLAVITACENTNSITNISVAGRTISVAQILETVMQTKYVVTYESQFGNQRGGAANSANMTDTIYYGTILGTPSQTTSGGVLPVFPGYASYANGMEGLVIHEASHMTQAGDEFYKHSIEVAFNDPTAPGKLYQSTDPQTIDYSTNNEAFANEIEQKIAIALQIGTSGLQPIFTSAAVTPESIYQSHTGQPYPG